MPSNKFSISLSKLDYQLEPQIHFLTHVPKVLSLVDAVILLHELEEVLESVEPADRPKEIVAPASFMEPVEEVKAEPVPEPTPEPTPAPIEEIPEPVAAPEPSPLKFKPSRKFPTE